MGVNLHKQEFEKYVRIGAGIHLERLEAEIIHVRQLFPGLSVPAAATLKKVAGKKVVAGTMAKAVRHKPKTVKAKSHHSRTPKARRAARRRMKKLWADGVLGKKNKKN